MVEQDEFDDEDELDDRELPDESDMDSFDEPGIMPCPHCRQMVSDEAERCPHCGNYISDADAPRRHLPLWLVIGIILAFVIAMLVWTTGMG
jgi:hypothetical protein